MIIATAASTAAAAVRTAVAARRNRTDRAEAQLRRRRTTPAEPHVPDWRYRMDTDALAHANRLTVGGLSAPVRRMLAEHADIEKEQLALLDVCPPRLLDWAKTEVDRRATVFAQLRVQSDRVPAHPRLVALRSLTRDFTHGDI